MKHIAEFLCHHPYRPEEGVMQIDTLVNTLGGSEGYSSSKAYFVKHHCMMLQNVREEGSLVFGEYSCVRLLTCVCKGHTHRVYLYNQ